MRVQLKKKIIGRSLLALLAIAIALPSMAHNRVPSITFAPSIDRYEVDDRHSEERELVVIDRATRRHFESVSRVELQAEPIALQLETRIRSITFTTDRAPIRVFPVSQKLASGLLALRDENNINDASDLARKTWWAMEFQALPFAEPATGLIYARARWYDPSTGSFLTPDPEGYADSSNLYAAFAGDPVNNSDPTGRCLGIDEAGRPCGEYARMLPDFLVEALGLNDLPSTGSKKIDKTIRRVSQAPARVAALPATVLLSTGESSGEVAYRMERSTFHGEQAFDGSVDDALLVTGAMGDVATVAAPLAMLEGAPELIGSRASQRGSFVVKGTKKGPGAFVAKNETMSAEAAAYQDAVANGQPGQVYRVPYENPNPRGRPHVDFDGVQGSFAVDTKLSVVTRSKTVGQAVRQAESLRQSGARGIWKVPSFSEALRARAMIQQANAADVLSVVIEK